MNVDPLISLTLRALLATLLVSAAMHKLRDPAAFADILRGYRLVPEGAEAVVGVGIGGVEALTAVALVVPGVASGAGWAAALLLCAYTAAIGINLVRGRRNVDCGCFGPAGRGQTLSEWLVVRNSVLIAGTLVVAAPVGVRSLGAFDAFVGAAACSGGALLWVGANQLLAQWPRMRLLRRAT